MTYNRDLQEDKGREFGHHRHRPGVSAPDAHAMLSHTSMNERACVAAGRDPALLATDLAGLSCAQRMAFRQAHHAVGAVVALARKAGQARLILTHSERFSVGG